MSLRVAELETLFTADITDVETKAKAVEKRTDDLAKKDPKVTIGADSKPAIEGLEKVEAAAKKLVSAETVAKVDANISAAETKVDSIKGELDYLDAMSATMDVTADIEKAKAELGIAQALLGDLKGARAVIDVDADTSGAEAALEGAKDAAGEAGADSGAEFSDKIIGVLGAIPVAGAVAGLGIMAGKALLDGFQDGLQVEVRQDRLEGLTGITEEQAAQFGRTASEAYSTGFGESIAGNMDTARIALQQGLLDPEATRRDSQQVIESLGGIADAMEEEVAPIARAATQMMRTGLVGSAQEAFDVIAAGTREGVNAGEDLLDTFIEYGTHFRDLGLSAPEALGLLNQGLEGGAFNADKVADALKELTIRTKALDNEDALKSLGLNAQATADAFATGGPVAKAALEEILTGLQGIEDPGERARLAVELFGTQAEDMAGSMDTLDLTTAVDGLNGVEGAAKRMFDTLASNDASSIENAKRNIEVAADGIKGALAAAFSEPLGNFADWVSQNRGPIMEFIGGLVNGALDIGAGFINFTADSTEAIGEFVSGPIADLVAGLATILDGMSWAGIGVPGAQQAATDLTEMAEGMRGFKDSTADTADSIRERFLPGIEDARTRFNEFNDAQIDDGYLHDSMLRVAGAVEQVGYAADGATPLVDAYATAQDGSVQASGALEEQLLSSAAALADELTAAEAAGEGQDELTTRYNATRDALAQQLETMGLTTDQAYALVDAVLQTPEKAETAYSSNSQEEKDKVDALATKIVELPDGTFAIVADTGGAKRTIDAFVTEQSQRQVRINVSANAGGGGATAVSRQHDGSVLMPMAHGGALTPMAPIAQAVDPNTWRIIGDRMKDREFYIPDDGSPRSRAILAEAMRSFGVRGMADGGTLAPAGGLPLTAQVSGSLVRELGDYLYSLMASTGQSAFSGARSYTDSAIENQAVMRP